MSENRLMVERKRLELLIENVKKKSSLNHNASENLNITADILRKAEESTNTKIFITIIFTLKL